jgi:hypothetical protein
MSYFVANPVVVEAIQYLPDSGPDCNCNEVAKFCGIEGELSSCVNEDCSDYPWEIDGVIEAWATQWIIKEGDGFRILSNVLFQEQFHPAIAFLGPTPPAAALMNVFRWDLAEGTVEISGRDFERPPDLAIQITNDPQEDPDGAR